MRGWLANQFARPSGLVGRFVGWLMNRNNVKMNARAIERLAPSATDRVLELGFGGGINLRALAARSASVTGVDPSFTMVAAAARTHADLVRAGKLTLSEGTADAIPSPDGAYDAACTVNTIYFWRDRPRALREIHRALAPGGRLVVGFLRGERMEELGSFPPDVFTYVKPDVLVEELRAAGFARVDVERPDGAQWVTALAARD